VSNNGERLLKALGSDEIAMQMLTSKERELLARFDEEVDKLIKERGILADSNEPDELIEEAFRLIPGSERALHKCINISDGIFSAGSG
jgi:uncharacterized protein YcgL (UPF0745 family)